MTNMLKTALEHAWIAVFVQLLVAIYLCGIHGFSINHGVLSGGFTACAAFLFREIAQHEYKGGGPTKVGILYGLKQHWTLDSALDVLFPVFSTGFVWILFRLA